MEFDCELQDAISRIAKRMCGQESPLPAIGCGKAPWYVRLFHLKPDRLTEIRQPSAKQMEQKGGSGD